MFLINYQFVRSDTDSFLGQHGFFQLCINEYTYGDVFPQDIANKLIPDEIADWFNRIIDVLLELRKHKSVALSDYESYNTWIEFLKLNDLELQISLRLLKKGNGTGAIEYYLPNALPGDWTNQKISIAEFEAEVIKKTNQYVEKVLSFSPNCEVALSLKKKLGLV